MSTVSAATKLKVLWRGLWLQSSWSFKGMQTVGFVHALMPLVEARDGEKREKLLNHLELFNTHPFLAPAAIASAAVAEAGESGPSREAADARRFMMGAMGGMGDSFFWGGLKFLAACLGVLLAVEGVSWAPLVMIGLFTAASLWTRWWALDRGLRSGKAALLDMQRLKPVLQANRLKLAVAAAVGWIVVRHAASGSAAIGFTDTEGMAFAAVVAMATAFAAKKGTDPLLIIYAAFIAALFLGMA